MNTFRGHKDTVITSKYSNDGNSLVTGSLDKSIIIWDGDNAALKVRMEGHTGRVLSVSWSCDDLLLASGSSDKTVRIWRVADGTCTNILDGHSNHVYKVSWAPTGHRVAFCSDHLTFVLQANDGRVELQGDGEEGNIGCCVAMNQGHSQKV